jgi:hypothetical protein
LSEENLEKAIEVNLRAAEERLNRAKLKSERDETEKAEGAINEFKEMRQFGEEIAQIAQGLGRDTTAVEKLVGRATSIHLEILAEVYERVPEQAKEAVEGAMEVSVKGHERAIEFLREKGVLDEELLEEPSVLEKVPFEIRERVE